jgi:hypothetical protein
MTTRESPSADNPAVRANGTVNPSERPIVASDMIRASTLKPFKLLFASVFSVVVLDIWDSVSFALQRGRSSSVESVRVLLKKYHRYRK